MLFEINEDTRKKAKSPHELFMLNLLGFNLLAAPASIALDVGMAGLLIPLVLSLSVVSYIWIRAVRPAQDTPWFVIAHWKLAANRRILLAGYIISAAIIGLALIVASGSDKAEILIVALTRVAIVPTLLTVMVCFALESSGIFMAGKAELPNGMVKKFPPPVDVMVKEDPAANSGDTASK
ncbi:MAG TPA: hypothetical protein PLZ16_12210 [Gammaproteobacteria bacterium]|nr:hypothetical protein [Gammaproteobacteria bacterium]